MNHQLLYRTVKYSICPEIRFFCTEITKKIEPKSPETSTLTTNEKLVKVAIIGVPNVGKSTFINNLIDHRVCPTSSKVHTTTNFSRAICNKNNSQIIFFDTPGLVTKREIKKHQLDSSFLSSCRHSIQNSNLIGVLHDVSNPWTRNELHPTVLEILNAYPKVPSFLVLNKIDLLKSKRVLLDVIKILTENTLVAKEKYLRLRKDDKKKENLENVVKHEKPVGWPHFSEIFMVSSLNGDGLSKVMDFVLNQSKSTNWEYPSEKFTDRSPEELIVESVRARLLDYLPQEIPYLLKSEMDFFSNDNGKIYAAVQVTCPNPRIEKLVSGESNGKLRQITERVTSDLVETFGVPISLTIATVCKNKK